MDTVPVIRTFLNHESLIFDFKSSFMPFGIDFPIAFVLLYEMNKDVVEEGDTCIVDIRNGLWGIQGCRGIKCNGEWAWRH